MGPPAGSGVLAIVSAGPSAQAVTERDLEGKSVLAVNFAIRHPPVWERADWWISFDPWEILTRQMPEMPRAARLRPGAGAEINRSVLELTYAGVLGCGIVLPTSIAALCWGRRRAFERIDLYGYDMAGTGTPLHPGIPYDQALEPRADVDAPRWVEERRLFDAVTGGVGRFRRMRLDG